MSVLVVSIATGIVVWQRGPVETDTRVSGVDTISASGLADSIGVNVHETYNDTTYALNNNTSNLVSALKRSGIRWIRIGLKVHPPVYEREFLKQVRSAGIRILAIVGSPESQYGDYQIGDSRALIDSLTVGDYRGEIDLLELPNETDLNLSSDWSDRLAGFSQEYVTALRGNPKTSRIPIVGASVGRAAHCSALTSTTDLSDYINLHPYTGSAAPESADLTRCVQDQSATNKPVIASEFGWTTDLRSPRGVSEEDAEYYIPRALIWNFAHGVRKSFIYELFDQRPDPDNTNDEWHFGLMGVSGSEADPASWQITDKPALRSVQTLMRLLTSNPDSRSALGVQLRVVGASRNLARYAIRFKNGEVALALWRTGKANSTEHESVHVTSSKPVRLRAIQLGSGRVTAGRRLAKSNLVTVYSDVTIVTVER